MGTGAFAQRLVDARSTTGQLLASEPVHIKHLIARRALVTSAPKHENYFAMLWSHCGDAFRRLDRWIRMRLRCMKFKRKSQVDNVRIRLKHFRHMGLLSLSDLRTLRVAG